MKTLPTVVLATAVPDSALVLAAPMGTISPYSSLSTTSSTSGYRSMSSHGRRVREQLERLTALLPHYHLSVSLIDAYRLPRNINAESQAAMGTRAGVSSSFMVSSPSFSYGTGCEMPLIESLLQQQQQQRERTAALAAVTVVRVLGTGSSGVVLYAEKQRPPNLRQATGSPITSTPMCDGMLAPGISPAALSLDSCNVRDSTTDLAAMSQFQSQSPHPGASGGGSATRRGKREGGFGFALKYIDLEKTEFGHNDFTIKHAIREIDTLRNCNYYSILRIYNYFFVFSDGTVCTNVDEVKRAYKEDLLTASDVTDGEDAEDDGLDSEMSPPLPRRITSIIIEMEYVNNGDLRGEITKRRRALDRQKERWCREDNANMHNASAEELPLSLSFRGAIPSLTEFYFSKRDLTMTFFQILAGVCYLHEQQNTMHRDMKSENVLLSGNGTVKIGDFGFSKEIVAPADSTAASTPGTARPPSALLSNGTSPQGAQVLLPAKRTESEVELNRQKQFQAKRNAVNSFCGTPLYMAPEIWRREANYSSKIDLFSMGVILYEMLTLQRPPSVQKATSISATMVLSSSGGGAAGSSRPRSSHRRRRKVVEHRITIMPDVEAQIFRTYGQEYLDLLTLLLKSNPGDRPSAMEVLSRFPMFRAASAQLIEYALVTERKSSSLAARDDGVGAGATASLLPQLYHLHDAIVAHEVERGRQEPSFSGRMPASELFTAPIEHPPPQQLSTGGASTDCVRSSRNTPGRKTGSSPGAEAVAIPTSPPCRVIFEGAVAKRNAQKGSWKRRYMLLVQRSHTQLEIRVGVDKSRMEGPNAEQLTENFADFIDAFATSFQRGTRDPDNDSRSSVDVSRDLGAAGGDTTVLSRHIIEDTSRFSAAVGSPNREEKPLVSAQAPADWFYFILMHRSGTTLSFRVRTEAERADWVRHCLAARHYLNTVRDAGPGNAAGSPGRRSTTPGTLPAHPTPRPPPRARSPQMLSRASTDQVLPQPPHPSAPPAPARRALSLRLSSDTSHSLDTTTGGIATDTSRDVEASCPLEAMGHRSRQNSSEILMLSSNGITNSQSLREETREAGPAKPRVAQTPTLRPRRIVVHGYPAASASASPLVVDRATPFLAKPNTSPFTREPNCRRPGGADTVRLPRLGKIGPTRTSSDALAKS